VGSWRLVAARVAPSSPPDVVRLSVLPSSARLRRSRDFSETVRRGERAGRPTLVVHLTGDDEDGRSPHHTSQAPSARAGFVVSRAVGGSVERHAVVRRLRHVVRSRLEALPAGTTLVIRALPSAAQASSDTLARDLDSALKRIMHKREHSLAMSVKAES